MGNIKYPDAHSRTRVDWDFLNNIRPRGIRPTDLDGFVEYERRGLFLEHNPLYKEFPDGKNGQHNTFRNICLYHPDFFAISFQSDLDEYRRPVNIQRIRTYSVQGIKDGYEPNLETIIDLYKRFGKQK
jgi:hypothetical protein